MVQGSGFPEVNKLLGEQEQIKRFRLVTEICFGGEKDSTVLTRIRNGITGILKGLPKF
ncbi:MAG: hypothetical protein MUF36_08245 [Bacteroidales bacterium]|nr:hypothetical protein [Bacteroidales bacterium]